MFVFSALQAQISPLDGLSQPSVSFAILVTVLVMVTIILWRRYRSRRSLMARVAELEALSAAGRAIVAAELDIVALCELIAQEAGKVINNRTFQVGLFENEFYKIMYWTVDGRLQPLPQTFDLRDESGLVGWIRTTQKPLLVHDFHRELDSLPAKPRYISDTPPRSAIFIPLVSGEQSIGILAAQGSEPNRFNEEDLRRLMILANQAAAAIANARLYEQERMRAAHLELVGKIARQVNAVEDLDEIFDQVVTLTRQTFDFHPVSIFGIDAATGEAVLQASSLPDAPLHAARIAARRGIVGAAAETHETIVCNNTAEDSRFQPFLDSDQRLFAAETRAEIAIPLLVNHTVVGVLDVQSPQVGVFTPTEQMVLETLAAEVANAIYKAQQLALQQSQAWTTTAQLQVAEALSRSSDLDEIATAVTRLTPMLVGVSFCGLLLWDAEQECYGGAALYGADAATAERFAQRHFHIGDWNALDAVHVGRQALTTRQIPPWLQRDAAKTDAQLDQAELLPLLSAGQDQMQGVMIVTSLNEERDSARAGQPGARRAELLHNIARQAGQAIESTRLRIAQQEEAWVNTALLQVAEAVNSLIDLNEILDTIARLVPLLVGVESIIILIWDESRKLFMAGPSYGISEMGRGLLETLEFDREEFFSITSQTADARASSATYFALRLPHWLEKVLGTKSAYTFPLNARARLVGALLVGASASVHPRSLSLRRLNILNGIAQQAATAVVNNQLYQESAERARLQQELNVAHEIQASFLPNGNPDIPGCSVASLWQAARQVSGDFYDFLQRSDGTWGIVIADVADKGVPAALFMAVSRTILRTVAFNRHDPADVLMRVNQIIDLEAQSDLFVTVFYAIWNPQNEMLTYANAGHNPPILLKKNGQPRLLKEHGMALGVLPDIQIKEHTVRLHPGDTLILYTDGVTEAMNEDLDEFGMERLLLAARAGQTHNAAAIIQSITDNIRDHAGETPQFDDITLVVLKRHSEK